jgi:hypothetical protein
MHGEPEIATEPRREDWLKPTIPVRLRPDPVTVATHVEEGPPKKIVEGEQYSDVLV